MVGSFHDIFSDVYDYLKENYDKIVYFVVIVSSVVGTYFLYGFYIERKNMAAHSALVDSLEYYNAKVDGSEKSDFMLNDLVKKEFKTEEEKWRRVVEIMSKAYSSNSSAGLAEMFVVYKSIAMFNLKDYNAAFGVMLKAASVSKSKKLSEIYKFVAGVIATNSDDDTLKERGVSIIGELASSGTIMSYIATYVLGYIRFVNADFAEAKRVWNGLDVKMRDSEMKENSLLTEMRNKLATIDADVQV